MRFVLFAEGKTEHAVRHLIGRWIEAKTGKRVAVRIVVFRGNADYLATITRKVHVQLDSPVNHDAIGVGLLDLYGLPIRGLKGLPDVDSRYHHAKRGVEQKVKHKRFHQFFAVHETEAWLLGDPECLPSDIRSKLHDCFDRPETVDMDDPPSARIKRAYLQTMPKSYKKAIMGPRWFDKLDIERATERCPYLKGLLDSLVSFVDGEGA